MNSYDQLREYAKDYHIACERYDRIVCTGIIGKGGGIMPATNHEFILINKNAIIQASIYFGKAYGCGFDKESAQRILVMEAS